MNFEELKAKYERQEKEDILSFIRERLSFDKKMISHFKYITEDDFTKEHLRFDMSGYEDNTGECTVSNMAILNRFADLGIYDYTSYLFLDFYEGTPTLYLRYWGEEDNYVLNNLGGLRTVESFTRSSRSQSFPLDKNEEGVNVVFLYRLISSRAKMLYLLPMRQLLKFRCHSERM